MRALLIVALFVAGTACTQHQSPFITQPEAEAQIDAGPALNTTTASYRLAHVHVTLEKVVRLPDGMLGLRFSFGTSPADCCSLFPRVGLTGADGTIATATTDIAVPVSDIGPDGVLPMRMWLRGTRHKPSFKVDLAGLGVPIA